MARKNPSNVIRTEILKSALAVQFGAAYHNLSEVQRAILAADLELLTEEGGRLRDPMSAARELRRRLGGPKRLPSYIATLEAGLRAHRTNPPRKAVARLYDRMRKAGYGAKDAKFIADEHQAAHELGISVGWEEDQEEPGHWVVIARDEDGEVIDSLAGIDLGDVGPDAHHSDPYQWDAEAQVISEGRRR